MQENDPLDDAWVAVHTRVYYEKKAAEQLYLNGYECFLPLRSKKVHVTAPDLENDREQSLVPLFPGYLFCRYKPQRTFHINRASGVIKIVGIRGIPEVIPDIEMDSIKMIVASGLSTTIPCQYLKVGLKVRVCSGPFNGVEGYLVAVNKNRCKIASGISAIGKAIVIHLVDTDICILPTGIK